MTPRKPSQLRLLEGGFGMVDPEPRWQIAAQAITAGPQEYRVYGGNAQATARGHGVISIRVGRVLIYLEDQEALLTRPPAPWSEHEDSRRAPSGPRHPP